MRAGKGSWAVVFVVGYLVVSFATPSAATAMQQIVSVLYSARITNTERGQLVLPGGMLDTTDVLEGVTASDSMTISAFVSVAERGGMSGSVIVFSNPIDVTATVEGKRKPKVLTRLRGQLSQGELNMSQTVKAKKMIDKGPVTFDIATGGDDVVPYNADVTYKIARSGQ